MSLEDEKRYKSIRRHLGTRLALRTLPSSHPAGMAVRPSTAGQARRGALLIHPTDPLEQAASSYACSGPRDFHAEAVFGSVPGRPPVTLGVGISRLGRGWRDNLGRRHQAERDWNRAGTEWASWL
jgi:hypothetical protein